MTVVVPAITLPTVGLSDEEKDLITEMLYWLGRYEYGNNLKAAYYEGEQRVQQLGIAIPPNDDFTGGATVTVRNSLISGNLVAPTDTVPIGPTCPNGNHCPFALAAGGGVDSWGPVTLVDTTVRNNRVGSASGLSTLASDADGDGRFNVVGHSMGGLVARYYLRYGAAEPTPDQPVTWAGARRIRNLILVAVPSGGSLPALEGLLFGNRVGLSYTTLAAPVMGRVRSWSCTPNARPCGPVP